MWRNVKEFVWNNRAKIAATAVVAVGVTLYATYTTSSRPVYVRESSQNNKNEKNSIKPSMMRSRLLLRLRKMFEVNALKIFPTLNVCINKIVDIDSALRAIREFRKLKKENSDSLEYTENNNPEAGNDDDKESFLWEELKIQAFTILYVTAYMLSVTCVLLRIQLHLLGRYTKKKDISSTNAFNTSADNSYDSINFEALIRNTYEYLLDAGLSNFAGKVRIAVVDNVRNWVPNGKKAKRLTFAELYEMNKSIRATIETDMALLVKSMIIPDDSAPDTSRSLFMGGEISSVHTIQNQTWDIVESPMFIVVLNEVLETCFTHIFDSLQRDVFSSDESDSLDSRMTANSIYLASLLPQLSLIASRMLPQDNISNTLREISSGIALDSFCVAITDSYFDGEISNDNVKGSSGSKDGWSLFSLFDSSSFNNNDEV